MAAHQHPVVKDAKCVVKDTKVINNQSEASLVTVNWAPKPSVSTTVNKGRDVQRASLNTPGESTNHNEENQIFPSYRSWYNAE